MITVGAGAQTLARLVATSPARNAALFPALLAHLEPCRGKDAPGHAERALPVGAVLRRADFAAVLERRLSERSSSQAARIGRVLTNAES